MTKREILERKAEKRREWARGRESKADQERNASDKLSDAIPFGQPILVGHHSEKRARRDQARIFNGMRKTAEHRDMAEHHRDKAEGIEKKLKNTIFSDDDDAIEQLKAKIERLEGERTKIKEYNKKARKEGREQAPSFMLANLGGNISSVRKRIKSLETKNKRTLKTFNTEEQAQNYKDSDINTGKIWQNDEGCYSLYKY